MTRCRSTLAGAALTALTLGCGESATLVLAVNAVAPYATTSTVTVTGLVTRTPPKENAVITVTASGAQQVAVDTAEASGAFTLQISLVPNAANTIMIVAQDRGGAVSDPVTVTVTQDGVAPTVVSMTPSGDGVAPTQTPTIEVRFSEPVVTASANAGLEVFGRAHVLSGVSSLSADSLTLTFVAGEALEQNAVYAVGFRDLADVAGNAVVPSPSLSCIVTQRTATAGVVESDPTSDLLATVGAAGTSPSDLVELRLAVDAQGVFSGVFRFTTVRSLDLAASNNVEILIELDTDQDSTTGFRTLKDTIFINNSTLHDQYGTSGTRSDYVIDVLPGSPGDTGFVGQNTAFLEFDITALFVPTVCGRFVGFAIPMAALGSDDGNMNYLLTTWNYEDPQGNEIVIDAVPMSGHLTTAFAGQFAPLTSAPTPPGPPPSTPRRIPFEAMLRRVVP